jgi:hypothetical protein
MNERIYQDSNHDWFFHVRGNQVVGPFVSYEHAESALSKHVATCRQRSVGRFFWPRHLLPGRLFRKAARSS